MTEILAQVPPMILLWAHRALVSEMVPVASAAGQSPAKAMDPSERYGGLAVISVRGRLRKDPVFDFFWGDRIGTPTYGEIEMAVRRAAEDETVQRILLIVDSLGGEWPGLLALADVIAAAAARKKVVAYVVDYACSAAYCLAAQASEIVCSRAAELGSLGAFCVLIDRSQAQAQRGLKFVVVTTAELKGAVAAGKITQAVIDDSQRQIADMAALFFATVARGRGWSEEDLAPLRDGRTHFGARAQELGLADRVASLEDVVRELTGEPLVGDSTSNPSSDEETEDQMSKVGDLLGINRASTSTAEAPPTEAAGPVAAAGGASGVALDAGQVTARVEANLVRTAQATAQAAVRCRLQALGSRVTPGMRRCLEPLATYLQTAELLNPRSIPLADGSEATPVEALYAMLEALPAHQALTAGELAGATAGEATARPAFSAPALQHLLSRGITEDRLRELQAKYGFSPEVEHGADE